MANSYKVEIRSQAKLDKVEKFKKSINFKLEAPGHSAILVVGEWVSNEWLPNVNLIGR